MVGVVLQSLIVKVFSLDKQRLVVVHLAQLMVCGRKIVISIGVVGIGGNGLLEFLQGRVMLSLLVKFHALYVVSLASAAAA